MIICFYILAAILLLFSFRSFLGGIRFIGYIRSELAKPYSGFTPFVSVIAPCKGIEDGITENLSAVLKQDYPEYEVIFVVDDEADPAAGVTNELSKNVGNSATGTRLVIAPKAVGSSQKVENLREAVLHLDPRSKAIVFVDSDARPSKDWLACLVAPLERPEVGAATGYRWFISKKRTFASELRSAWNASIASSLGPNTGSNFCWGGSMAIGRDVFERLKVREKWTGTLSDDFTVTRLVKESGLAIYFVPQALTASVGNCSFPEMLEFTTRQLKITRVYAPTLWKLSMIGSGLFNLVFVWALLILILYPPATLVFILAAVTLAGIAVFSIGKSWLRLRAARLVLTKYDTELRRQFWPQNTLWIFTQAIFFVNSLAAAFSRRIVWRGVIYEMISPKETLILRGIDPARDII